jgi:hypothetical protein
MKSIYKEKKTFQRTRDRYIKKTKRGNRHLETPDVKDSEDRNKVTEMYASEVALQSANEEGKVIVDGGASIHITKNREWFETVECEYLIVS